MSLINKLLSDLEGRQAYLSNNQDYVLDGLYSAYDVEMRYQPGKKKYYYIILLFISAAIYLSLSYFNYYLNKESYINVPANFTKSHPDMIVNTDVISARNPETIEENNIAEDSQITHRYDVSLKLDQELKFISEKIFDTINGQSKEKAIIQNINIESNGEIITLTFLLPIETDYLVYSLEAPDRTVFEIDDVDYSGELPDINRLDYITGVRKRLDEDGNFMFVLESQRPLLIEKTDITEIDNQFQLQVSLLPKEAPEIMEAEDSKPLVKVDESIAQVQTALQGAVIKIPHEGIPVSETDKLLYEGNRLYQQGQITPGLEKFYTAVKADESHVSARSTLAAKLIEQGQRDLAYSVLQEGLRLYPGQTEWTKLLAQAYIDAGDLHTAKGILSESIPDASRDPDYHALYAALLQKLELHKEAAITYRNLLQLYPDNGIWWMGLAISLEAISRNKDALFAYRNALNGQSLTPETHQYITQRIRFLNQQLANDPA